MSVVVCDVCGEAFDSEECVLEIQEMVRVHFVGGYASIFGDGVEVKCDICQHCFEFIFRGRYNVIECSETL